MSVANGEKKEAELRPALGFRGVSWRCVLFLVLEFGGVWGTRKVLCS